MKFRKIKNQLDKAKELPIDIFESFKEIENFCEIYKLNLVCKKDKLLLESEIYG